MNYTDLYKGDPEAQKIGKKIVDSILELYDHFYPDKADKGYVVLINKRGKKHLHDKKWLEDKDATFFEDFKDFIEMVVPTNKQIARWAEDMVIERNSPKEENSDE